MRVYRAHFVPLLTIAVVVEVPLTFLQLVGERAMPTSLEGGAGLGFGLMFLGLVIVGASILGNVLMQGAFIVALATQYVEPRIEPRTVYEAVWRRSGGLVGTFLLFILVVGSLFAPLLGAGRMALSGGGQASGLMSGLFLVGLPLAGAGVYFMVSWTFAFPATLLEGRTPRASLSRSRELVRGQWWRVFGIILVMAFSLWGIMTVSGFILNLILQGLLAQVARFLVSLVLGPALFVGLFLLYADVRARKEGYAFLAMATELRTLLRGPA